MLASSNACDNKNLAPTITTDDPQPQPQQPQQQQQQQAFPTLLHQQTWQVELEDEATGNGWKGNFWEGLHAQEEGYGTSQGTHLVRRWQILQTAEDFYRCIAEKTLQQWYNGGW